MRKSMKKLIALTLACLMLATHVRWLRQEGRRRQLRRRHHQARLDGLAHRRPGRLRHLRKPDPQDAGRRPQRQRRTAWQAGRADLLRHQGDAQEAVNVAKRLCAQDQVCAIIGPNASGQCIAIQSVLDQYKISDMSTVATNEKVTMQDGQLKEYNFRVCFLDPQQGKIAGSFVYDNLGLR